jgi:epsilon-lactone hydrolase
MIDPHHFAGWVSDEAKALFAASASGPVAPVELGALRRHYQAYNQGLLDAAMGRYRVAIAERRIGEVLVHSVAPAGGPTDPRTLICLHGGAFMWGSGAGALLEAVPVAATTGMQVFAIDYRLAPEHPFPAAVDDVLAVYTDLMTRQEPGSIGLYGCSAGGALTAQAIARMVHDGIPVPGGIAMLHGTGLEFEGDSGATASAFDPRATPTTAPTAAQLPYFASADLRDPLVMPGNHPAVLAQFPPSLLISGTRDFAASACSVMHRRLLGAGVESQFVLFDGLWHAHHMAVELPESQETFALLDHFFKAQLR